MTETKLDKKLLVALSELMNNQVLLKFAHEKLLDAIETARKDRTKINPYEVEILALCCIDSAYAVRKLLDSAQFSFADLGNLPDHLKAISQLRIARRHLHQLLPGRSDEKPGYLFGLNVWFPRSELSDERDGTMIFFRGAIAKNSSDMTKGFKVGHAADKCMQIVFFESNKHFANITFVNLLLEEVLERLFDFLAKSADENDDLWFAGKLRKMIADFRNGESLQIFYSLTSS